MFEFISLFSGVGGLDKGLEDAGMKCVVQVEIDDFCNNVLERHWPNVLRYKDVKECGSHNLPHVDMICGGFPCQDLSISRFGSHLGLKGKNSSLVYEFARICNEIQPRWVLIENVMAIRKFIPAIKTIFNEWEFEDADLKASDFGAYTRRKRTFLVGHFGKRSRRKVFDFPKVGKSTFQSGGYEDVLPMCLPWKGGPSLERLGSCLVENTQINSTRIRKSNGISRRMDGHRYLALGNAVPVLMSFWIGKNILISDKYE